MTDFKSLIDCIRKEEVTLFLGSGFSLKAGAPSATSIVDTILKAMTKEERECVKATQLNDVAEEYEEMYNREALLSIIENLMSFKSTDTSDHQCLTKVPHFHHIITTNYDTLIEDSYGEDNAYVVRTSKDCTNLPKNKVVIFKIHGDFKSKDNIIITKQDYDDFQKNQKESLLWKYIQAEILTKDILFIGYSLDDSNIFAIMKDVKKSVGGQTRKFYLIAPGLKKHKIDRLAKTNVTYYDAKAEDLFPILFSSLDKNIHSDYKRQRISFSTLSEYSRLHKLNAIASEGKDHNNVHFNPVGQSEVKINFTIDKAIGDKLIANDASLYTEQIPNSLVPALKLCGDMLKSIDININGMAVGTKEDFPYLYLAPPYEEKEVSFRIMETGFIEKTSITQFKLNNCLTISAKMESFTLKFEFTLEQNNAITCSCNVTFTEKYKNNSEALKWIDLPIALWENKELIISSMPNMPLKFPKKDSHCGFNAVKQYYRNIKEIEMSYGIEFEEYNNYSSEALEKTNLLIQSYNESLIPIKIKDKECILDIDKPIQSIEKELSSSHEYYFVMTEAEEEIEFSGQIFVLKERHIIIKKCTILSISQIDSRKSQLKLRINTDSIYLQYTNNDIYKTSKFKKLM